jgi:hypothetical protein
VKLGAGSRQSKYNTDIESISTCTNLNEKSTRTFKSTSICDYNELSMKQNSSLFPSITSHRNISYGKTSGYRSEVDQKEALTPNLRLLKKGKNESNLKKSSPIAQM